jgi:hypothetical protein
MTEWKPIQELSNLPQREVLAVNNRTGVMALTQHDDTPERRGFNHRNGFNTATHYLDGIPDFPVYVCDHFDTEDWMRFCPMCGAKILSPKEPKA